MSNYLIHYGVKGSKWGFNKGKRNGKKVAQYEYDSQGNLYTVYGDNPEKERNGDQRPPFFKTKEIPMTSKARISYSKGRFNQTGERGPKLAFGSRSLYKSGTAAKNRKRAKSISNEKFSESIKNLKKTGKRAARKQKAENWLNDRKSYLSRTYKSVKNKLTKSKIGSSLASPKMGTNARSKATPKMGTNAPKHIERVLGVSKYTPAPKMGTNARKVTSKMGTNARSKATSKMGTNASKVAPKSRVELASRKVLSTAKKSYGLHDGKTMTVNERRSYGLHNGPSRSITGGRGVGERRVGSSGVRKAVNANNNAHNLHNGPTRTITGGRGVGERGRYSNDYSLHNEPRKKKKNYKSLH